MASHSKKQHHADGEREPISSCMIHFQAVTFPLPSLPTFSGDAYIPYGSSPQGIS